MTAALRMLLERPLPATLIVVAGLAVTALGVAHYPRSVVVFVLFQA